MLQDFVNLILVGFLWGATNPLIKKGSIGIENVKENTVYKQGFMEVKFLLKNWKYIVPFLLNQSGSLLYFLTLQNSDISLAVPVANALSFVFTAVVGRFLGEQIHHKGTYYGIVLTTLGITLCFLDKILSKNTST